MVSKKEKERVRERSFCQSTFSLHCWGLHNGSGDGSGGRVKREKGVYEG